MWTRCGFLLGIVLALVGAVQTQQPQTYGSGVSLTDTTPLVRVLDRAGDFDGKTVRVEGIVKAVCTHMVCCMALAPADAPDGRTMLVKVDDGVIVFPVSAKGRRAVAQGVVERVRSNDVEEQEAAVERAGKAGPARDNSRISWQLKATGALVY